MSRSSHVHKAPPNFSVDSSLEAWMINIRRHLHKYPETSYDEFKSAEFIQERLSELGIESSKGLGGTGVTAYIGNGASSDGCVALRADMDALPVREQTGLKFSSVHEGIMHACGHDGHVAMLLGAASLLRKGFSGPGRVKLIFQPAEEHGNGAEQLVREGVLDGVQAVFGGHIDTHFETGVITVDEGLICAYADPFQITIKGRGGMPHGPTKARMQWLPHLVW